MLDQLLSIFQHIFKVLFLCFGALLCAAPEVLNFAAQEQQPIVAVLDLVGSQNATAIVKMTVTGTLEEHIVGSKKYRAVDRVRTAQVLSEHSFARNGLVDNNRAKEIGKMLQADIVCVSELHREGGDFLVKCSLIDVVSGEVFASATELIEADSTIEIKKGVERAAMKLLGVENPREVQAEMLALKELAEMKKREQEEMEGLARERAIKEQKEQAERERRIREQAAREDEARAQAKRELEAREHEERLRAIREQADRDSRELAMIARVSVKPTAEGIKAAKAVINRLMPGFTYKKTRKGVSCTSQAFTQLMATRKREFAQSKTQSHAYLIFAEIKENRINAFSRYSYKTGDAAWGLNHDSLSITVYGKTIKTSVVSKTKSNTETAKINDDEILRTIAGNAGKSILVRISGHGGFREYVLSQPVQAAIAQTIELYDAMDVIKRAGVEIQESYDL